MYLPQHFEERNVEVLHALIRQHPLGMLVAVTPDGPEASHVPFAIDPQPQPFGTLRCHLARANPLWRHLAPQTQVLVVFQGAASYITPSWYAAKREHGKVVPTWNYVVVHAHGQPTVVHDAAWLRKLIDTLTDSQEHGRTEPWRVSDAPAEYLEKMLGAIVGVEIPVARLAGKWKLSQNRSLADRQGVIAGLEGAGGAAQTDVAALMKTTLQPG